MLTKEAILGAGDLKITRVEVKEWGGAVHLRALSLAERMQLEAKVDGTSEETTLVTTVAFALCDEKGTRLFTSDEDIAALIAKSAVVLLKLGTRARRLNALTKQDIEDMAGNSAAAPTGSTPSSSPSD